MPSLPRSPFGRRGRAAAESAPERVEPRVEVVESPGLRWINIERPRALEQAWLEEHFDFHPLDYEDVRSRNQRPKVDEYDDYLFNVLHFPRYDKAVSRLNAAEGDIFVRGAGADPAGGGLLRGGRLPDPPPQGAAAADQLPVRALPGQRGAARVDLRQ